MNLSPNKVLLLGIVVAVLILVIAFSNSSATQVRLPLTNESESLAEQAFQVLKSKCNSCHRRQNPFMVFNEKNMSRRASKIYKAVFLERSMPKGDEVTLTQDEFTILNKWLSTQNI